jgi:DNA-binding NtrC family response regulator
LRERKEDIHLLFRKFAYDFSEKYKSTPIVLDAEAQQILVSHRWPGNIRQLKNIAEQLSVLDDDKNITAAELNRVLPAERSSVPMLFDGGSGHQQINERDIFYKVLFDLRKDMNDLKGIVFGMLQNGPAPETAMQDRNEPFTPAYHDTFVAPPQHTHTNTHTHTPAYSQPQQVNNVIEIPDAQPVVESLSLEDKEIEMIKKALEKYNGKRKKAANELGISERTLYRKIKQYDLE